MHLQTYLTQCHERPAGFRSPPPAHACDVHVTCTQHLGARQLLSLRLSKYRRVHVYKCQALQRRPFPHASTSPCATLMLSESHQNPWNP